MESTAKQRKELCVQINRDWCKGCGICAAFCPKSALSIDGKAKAVWTDPDSCLRCGLCVLRCPDMAMSLD